MIIFTVSFFGHREINNPFAVGICLEQIVTNLIKNNEYVNFLIGRDGDFDQLVASTVRRISKQLDYGNTNLTLVMPYLTAEYRDNEKYFLDYYDNVELCSKSANSHFKSAIQIRNQSMIDRSDLVICCIQRNKGGAYKSVQYAKRKGVKVINIIDMVQ